MDLLSEFSHPTRWYSKLIAAALALVSFTVLIETIIAGFAIYRIVMPVGSSAAINLTSFPGRPQAMEYSVEESETRMGWFFPGLKSAPTILLCPGYSTTRGELLPLAIALQDNQYNMFLFDFGRAESKTAKSTLGFREVQELRAAISAVAEHSDVDRPRFGLWGTNMGAYTALAVAESDPRVRAVAVESVFDHPRDMAQLLFARSGLAALPLLPRFVEKGFAWLNYRHRETPPLSAGLSRLAGVPKLFLAAQDQTDLAASTVQLFALAPEPKEQALLMRGDYTRMSDGEKRDYENRIAAFFLLNLPTVAPAQQ